MVFLNAIIDKVKNQDSDLMLNEKPILKFSEKIREYKPIFFDGKRFVVRHPMHATCAVLMVTGQASSSMIDSELVSVKDPDKYYTDTSFRVARDTAMDKAPKQSG